MLENWYDGIPSIPFGKFTSAGRPQDLLGLKFIL